MKKNAHLKPTWRFRSLEDLPMGDTRYTVIKAGNREVGGMMATPPAAQGSPPIWRAYVTEDDVAGTAKELGRRDGSSHAIPLGSAGSVSMAIRRLPSSPRSDIQNRNDTDLTRSTETR